MDRKYCPYCMSPVKEGETCKNCGLTEGVYTPRDHHLPLGTVLNNRYLVGRVLGEGGFGITYIGCDLNLEMKVAIKEYFPIDRVYRLSKTSLQVSNYAHAVEKYQSGKVKFLREARTMARLDKQQNIVSVRDFFEENSTAYIVMEYVEGTTLKELVSQRGGRISAGELLHMLEPLFPALTSIHEMGLIHRDISPDNLMLENGKIKLLDFGCARESAAQSETMTIALKQGYAPIEQYQHKGQGPWTDVYALSATIYYCLTGKTPQSAVDRLSEEELIPPRKLGVDLTANQEAALLHGMNVKAKERFQSVEELYAALYTNVMPAPAEPVSAKQKNPAEQNPAEQNLTRPVSAPESGLDQFLQNDNSPVSDQTDGTAMLNSGEDPNLPKTGQNGEKTAKKRIMENFSVLKQRLNRNLIMILAGCAVLLVAVICIVLAVVPAKDTEEVNGLAANNTEGMAASTDGTQPGNESSDDPVEELETKEDLFADAVLLEESSMEAFQALMEDDTVPGIRVPEGVDSGSIYGTLSITKPVLIEENVDFILYDPITVQGENACLWIEGALGADCILQTADGGRVIADNPGCISPTLLWLEKEEDLRILNGGEPGANNLIIGGKDTLFQNAVEVRDEASLRQAVDKGQAAIICGDITIETALQFASPIMIEEGVTVTMQGDGGLDGIGDGFFLWNEGTLQGQLDIDSNAVIVNYGEINSIGETNTMYLGMNGILINLGSLVTDFVLADGCGQECIYNIGTLLFQGEGKTFHANLANYGSVVAQDGHFCQTWIHNYGEIFIAEGREGSSLVLRSYLLNMSDGRILIRDGAKLENDGVIEMYSGDFVCEPEGILSNEDGAIYCIHSVPNISPESGWIHFVGGDGNSYRDADPDRVRTVSRYEELYDALQDPGVDKVYLSGSILWRSEEALMLTKELEIPSGVKLTMWEGSDLILDGGILLNRGYMQVNNLTLTHGSSLWNAYGTIELHTPESVIKLGNVQGERDYSGTDCLMNDQGEILSACEIELYDNALMIQKGYLEGSMFHTRDHAYVANVGEIQWREEGSIEISGGAQFHNLIWQDWSQNLSINVDKGGEFRNCSDLVIESGNLYVGSDGSFQSYLSTITLGNHLSVWNDGRFYAEAECILQGYLENHGVLEFGGDGSEFVIDAPSGAENPACLNNQGEVYIWGPNVHIRSVNGEFIGNAATYVDNN